MGKKSKERVKDRRAKVEEMRRAQAQAERRRTLTFVVIAAVVGLGLIATAVIVPLVSARNDPANRPPDEIGVSVAQAGCAPVTDDKPSGQGNHVQPPTKVKYETVPPTSGQHYDLPLPLGRKFYAPEDDAPVEQLVHNLEHGYMVLWYDKDTKPNQIETLRGLSERIPKERPKFVVAPWDESYGAFPEGKDVAMAVWGHRQLCSKTSGEAVFEFSKEFPPSVAPEPTAA